MKPSLFAVLAGISSLIAILGCAPKTPPAPVVKTPPAPAVMSPQQMVANEIAGIKANPRLTPEEKKNLLSRINTGQLGPVLPSKASAAQNGQDARSAE